MIARLSSRALSCFAILPLAVLAACSQPEAVEDPRDEEIVRLHGRISDVVRDRDSVRQAIEEKKQRSTELVTEFFKKYPYEELQDDFKAALQGLQIDGDDSATFADVDQKRFLALATVSSFLDSYPYSKLPPSMSEQMTALGIDASAPSTFLDVDLVEFAKITGGFTWDSHSWQVKAQSLANSRKEEIDSLQVERVRLSTDLRDTQAQAERLDKRSQYLENALDLEREEHRRTRSHKQDLQTELTSFQEAARAASSNSNREIAGLRTENQRLERELEIELRGRHYQAAVTSAQNLIRTYDRVLDEMKSYYRSQFLLVSNFAYKLNRNGSVTGIADQSGYQHHNVWVRTAPGELEEDHFQGRWKTFRRRVKSALERSRKAKKKGATVTAQDLSGELEQLLKEIPKKLWIRVETPSGGRYRLDLTPTIDPIMERIESWQSL